MDLTNSAGARSVDGAVDSTTTVYRVDAHSNSLCQALYKLTTSEPQFCDVILRLNGTKREFKAHSPVLATCSAFFKTILSKPDNQYAKNVVVLLPDFIKADGLEPVLLFIYTGDLGINDNNVNSIYQVACLFELAGAVSLCHKYVDTKNLTLSFENAGTSSDKQIPVLCVDSNECSLSDSKANKENCTVFTSENVCPIAKTEAEECNNTKNQSVGGHNEDEMSVDDPLSDDRTADDEDELSDNQISPGVTTRSSLRSGRLRNKNSKSNNLPVRRSKRKFAGYKQKSLPTKKFPAKKRKVKLQIQKQNKGQESSGRVTKRIKSEDPPTPEETAPVASDIDQTLKFTDPAKYISELIDKNSDMLNEHATDSEGGGIKIVTRGKITYIFPDGFEVVLPPIDNPPSKPTEASNAKINEAGLPYEKIVDPLTCAECNITFPSAVLREEHILDKHKDQGAQLKQVMFQCLNCPFSTDFLRNMWFHCHWKHSYPLPDTLRQYCCGLCDYRAPAQGNIEVHIRRVHTHERPLMCDVCGQFFKSLDTLRGHRFYRHQDIYPFQCNVCEKQFKRRHKLDVHMRIHMGYKPFTCPDCPYATYTKFNLKDHVRKRHAKELDTTVK